MGWYAVAEPAPARELPCPGYRRPRWLGGRARGIAAPAGAARKRAGQGRVSWPSWNRAAAGNLRQQRRVPPQWTVPRASRLGDCRMTSADGNIHINRAPVLTLWATVVAEPLGFDRDTALTLGQA